MRMLSKLQANNLSKNFNFIFSKRDRHFKRYVKSQRLLESFKNDTLDKNQIKNHGRRLDYSSAVSLLEVVYAYLDSTIFQKNLQFAKTFKQTLKSIYLLVIKNEKIRNNKSLLQPDSRPFCEALRTAKQL